MGIRAVTGLVFSLTAAALVVSSCGTCDCEGDRPEITGVVTSTDDTSQSITILTPESDELIRVVIYGASVDRLTVGNEYIFPVTKNANGDASAWLTSTCCAGTLITDTEGDRVIESLPDQLWGLRKNVVLVVLGLVAIVPLTAAATLISKLRERPEDL